jgi:iron(III) transport system substrate-binding protein
MKKIVVLAVLVLLCVTMIAGNSLAAEKVKAYTTMEEPLAKALFEQFEKETGIVVEWVRLSSGEAVARIEAEKANPQASIWVGGVGTLHIDAKNKGLTAPYNSRMAGSIPDQFRDPEKFWIGLYVGPIAFCINTNRSAELNLPLPASWADIVNPSTRKKSGSPTPAPPERPTTWSPP